MDIATAVAWVQAAIWVLGVIIFLARIARAERNVTSWVFSNRLLIPIFVVGLIMSTLSLYWNYRNRPLRPDEWRNYKKEAVIGRTFTQERVLLDGRSYVRCTFDKVTLVYNGTAPFDFTDNHLIPPINVTSDNPAVLNTLEAAREFERLNREIGADVEGKINQKPEQK